MSTFQKVKAYFGMIPLDHYEDDMDDMIEPGDRSRYITEEDFGTYSRRHVGLPVYEENYPSRENRLENLSATAHLRGIAYPGASAHRTNTGSLTHGDLALDSRAHYVEETPVTGQISTFRPKDYGQARVVGERFREGSPVIMDLVNMDNADAKRLVDFAAGLVFALRGTFDKVATKVFLLSPAGIEVSAEDRKKIAETGFYSRDFS